MSCRYQLWLQYDVNKFWLSPKSNIFIEEPSDFENLTYSGGCCADVAERDWHFILRFTSGCNTLLTATTIYHRLQIYLGVACSQDLTINRKVCDESLLTYKIIRAEPKMIETVNQLVARPRILTIDLKLVLTNWIQTGEGNVLIG